MDNFTEKLLPVSAFGFALASLVVTGYVAWQQMVAPRAIPPEVQVEEVTVMPSPTPAASLSAELTRLEQTVEELSERVNVLEKRGPTTRTTNGIKETFLYLGSGSSTSRDWTSIDSAAVTFNTATYGTIKEIRFEAALSIISGEVHARLANKTTGAVYYDSVVTHNKSTSEWRTSGPIYLPSGSNEYVVQLRSSNGERANLDGARLKIIVQ